jgi:hypothetical protein
MSITRDGLLYYEYYIFYRHESTPQSYLGLDISNLIPVWMDSGILPHILNNKKGARSLDPQYHWGGVSSSLKRKYVYSTAGLCGMEKSNIIQ